MPTIGFDALGASAAKKGEPVDVVQAAALLVGGALLGTGIGAVFGRALLGGALGFIAGLAGCTADNPFFVPEDGVPDGGGSPDMSTVQLPSDMATWTADMSRTEPTPDMSSQPDMVMTPDMTQYLDMSKPLCIPSLENTGTGNFTIRFRVKTQAKELSTLVYQRNSINGSVDYWDIRMLAPGSLLATVHQSGPNASTANLITGTLVNDGAWHEVEVTRRDGVLFCLTDGRPDGSVACPQSVGALPPVGMAGGHPCEGANVDGTVMLIGDLAGVCLTRP